MKPGEVYERTQVMASSGNFHQVEKVGDRIEIEECGLQQHGHVDHARAIFLSGRRAGEKVQWAEVYIESDFRLVSS